MAKNYYLVLGVASDATTGEIKAAFRRRARELHPDRSGLESAPFIEIQEAYSVLSDPQRRRDYDRERLSLAPSSPWRPASEPLVPPRRRGEPFREVTPARTFREAWIRESFNTFRPSFDELFDRLWSNFEGLARPKGERLESLTVELVLSREEARRGGQVRVWVPARATCRMCGGHGAVGPYECPRCAGAGALTVEYPAEIEFPPGVRDGDAIRVPLSQWGIENLYLVVLLRVSEEE